MSQMPPFLRGYRQALRDVQLAVLLRGRTRSGPPSAWCAVLVAGDWISVPLRQLRETGIRSLDPEVRELMSTRSAKQSEFDQGYQAGFDKAVEIVAGWGRKMNNPAARDAIGETVERLQRARLQMISTEGGKLGTLRERKFAI
jgi:hypothetical protein